MNTMSCSTMNRKAKTCNEIGMLPSVRNVTEVLCFPFRSRNVNVCRVSDPRACNIQLPTSEAWITVLSCRSRNISQKGRNRLRRSKKVSYKHWGFRHRHIRDSQRSRNVNVCRVSDPRACNIQLPTSEAWITVLSCRSRNISQKGRNRLRRSKKVSYKHWGFRHRHIRDSQG